MFTKEVLLARIVIETSFDPKTYKLSPLDSNITLLSNKLQFHQQIVSFGDMHGAITVLINLFVTNKAMKPT